ncbi:GIN domain-containing protein [Mariniflexile sp. HNIBRBA6329]|uniref:GIN domain-containing protein n=1 Tax=Mariniflexile sp. HNIBRBA6329 TaxID=3373088 RepID=UPI003746A799
MNKPFFTIFFVLFFCFISVAQNPEKVKGNKNVTMVQTEIDPFHTIIVDEDFDIEIIYNNVPSVTIETDENLHEFIKFNVNNGVLTFDKTTRITSKKLLNITVNYDDSLTNIRTIDDGEILSLTTMNLANTILITEGSSKAGLTIKTGGFEFQSNGKSKVKLNLTCDNAKLSLTDNSKLDALIYSPKTNIDLYQRASTNIEGETDELQIKTDNFSNFNGKNFTAKTCNTLTEISSDVYLDVVDAITIDASGNSSVYLYGNPEIVIKKLADTSKIQKKEK